MSISVDSPRDHRGQVIADPATMERDHRAANLKIRGLSYREIAHEMECAVSTAFDMVQRAMKDIPNEDTALLRKVELAKLDFRERVLLGILGTKTPKTTNSGVVLDLETGKVAEDYDVKIRAIGMLNRVSERRARLLGLDMPIRIDAEVLVFDTGTVEGQVEYLRRILESGGGESMLLDGQSELEEESETESGSAE